MAKQLTIFVENRPGRLGAIAKSLRENNIDIRAFTIQDRGDYGLVKFIVNNPSQAYLALANLGCACALKEIIAISIPDKVGNFELLTSALAAQQHKRQRRLWLRPPDQFERRLLP